MTWSSRGAQWQVTNWQGVTVFNGFLWGYSYLVTVAAALARSRRKLLLRRRRAIFSKLEVTASITVRVTVNVTQATVTVPRNSVTSSEWVASSWTQPEPEVRDAKLMIPQAGPR